MSSNAVRESLARSERAAPVVRVLSGANTARKSECNGGSFAGAEEPLLSDLLNDPMTHQMMESDGVKQRHLMLVIAEVQARINGA